MKLYCTRALWLPSSLYEHYRESSIGDLVGNTQLRSASLGGREPNTPTPKESPCKGPVAGQRQGENLSNHDSPELVRILRERFPLLERISGQFGENLPRERIPWFFGLLLSAAMGNDRQACCFVIDKTEGTTALAAIFLALAQLQREFSRLAESYARTAMREGQHVRVKPSNSVYEYTGMWEEHPELFRLKVLNKPDYRTFPITEVLRLEPTTHKRPTGTLTLQPPVYQNAAASTICSKLQPTGTAASPRTSC